MWGFTRFVIGHTVEQQDKELASAVRELSHVQRERDALTAALQTTDQSCAVLQADMQMMTKEAQLLNTWVECWWSVLR